MRKLTKYTRQLTVRVNDDLVVALTALATAQNLHTAEYLRQLIIKDIEENK